MFLVVDAKDLHGSRILWYSRILKSCRISSINTITSSGVAHVVSVRCPAMCTFVRRQSDG